MALQINGEYVDDAVIRQEAASMRPRYEEVMQDMDPIAREMQLREWARENVIERVLLRQAAFKETPAPAPEEIEERLTAMFPPAGDLENCEAGATRAGVDKDAARQEIEAQLRVEALIRKVSDAAPKPKQKEITEFYKKNRAEFRTPPMVHASHIVKNVGEGGDEEAALAAIREAEAELKQGRPFAEVADQYSDCAGQGGSLGWFPMGEMVEEFEAVVFPMQAGQVSDVFRSVFGWHIATVHEKRPEGYRTLDDVKPQIEASLGRERQEKALEDYVDALRAKADVKTVKKV
ncbi:MAG TPA: peptidylprolyl isomerase [Bryobacteraceae bacterium]|nr:peptidylprolyl isomerase [Bryobacteraceae bacterium]